MVEYSGEGFEERGGAFAEAFDEVLGVGVEVPEGPAGGVLDGYAPRAEGVLVAHAGEGGGGHPRGGVPPLRGVAERLRGWSPALPAPRPTICFCWDNDTTSACAKTDVGKACYVKDDHTVTIAGGSAAVVAGYVKDVDADGVHVSTLPITVIGNWRSRARYNVRGQSPARCFTSSATLEDCSKTNFGYNASISHSRFKIHN